MCFITHPSVTDKKMQVMCHCPLSSRTVRDTKVRLSINMKAHLNDRGHMRLLQSVKMRL